MNKTYIKILFIFLVFTLASGSLNADIMVQRVIDGDTVVLVGGERLRYIGIDTPELKHRNKDIRTMAMVAKSVNKKLVSGKKLVIKYDIEKRDKYGRLLAYVYTEDGTFVNAELMKMGYAQILTVPPNVMYADHFLSLQRQARKAKRGFWSNEYADFKNMRKGYKSKRWR